MSVKFNSDGRSAAMTQDGRRTDVAADAAIECLRDQVIIEPLPIVHSAVLAVIEETKPVRGIVKAVGPGKFWKEYDHPDKHRRTKYEDGKVFQPTSVKPGDVVELGGYDHRGFAFQSFYWGRVKHIICQEADICGVWDDLTEAQARAEAAGVTA